jgi:hypothetical protein
MINVEEGWAWDKNQRYDAFLANFMRKRMLKPMQQETLSVNRLTTIYSGRADFKIN